jgi:hypothetical protein
MAPKTIRHRIVLTVVLLLVISAILVPQHSVFADPLTSVPVIPDLTSFTLTVRNGNNNTLRGVYAGGIFAFPVVQQPAGNAGYVSTKAGIVTQFNLASNYGNIGLLAHNTLSGQYFSQLIPGERILLIYGDGRIESYLVINIYRYQAVSPESMNSDFIDLDTQQHLSALDLFRKVYTGSQHVTFQTCIESNGNLSWGRLFVIAIPETHYTPSSQ